MRKPIVAGNWKMNMTPAQTVVLIKGIKPLITNGDCDVVVCPPACCLAAAKEALENSGIALGAQNIHWAQSGAYTGEISGEMLKELGVEYVIVGHSERRQYFGETDETVNLRAKAAIKNGLVPIICVGESLAQREAGQTQRVVSAQTKLALGGIEKEYAQKLVIAYEPIWAIGTGKTATAQQAEETIGQIRAAVKELYGEAAQHVRIQYGGSMKPQNAAELMAMENIDGGLIGGASLKAADFAAIIAACNK